MHATERERLITAMLKERGFVSFQDLEKSIDASPATLRRDLSRLANIGKLTRVRGGVERIGSEEEPSSPQTSGLQGVPFHENVNRYRDEKAAIGRTAAGMCVPGEAIIIDGGSTTLQMCRHLAGLRLQVLTNSLHIVSALLQQTDTRVLVPGGAVFREQNIILTASGDDCMPRFYAPRLFMGAASIGPQGLMQADIVLVAAERRFIDRVDEIIVLVDSSKFASPSGNVVCGLDEIDVIVTDAGISDRQRTMLASKNVKVVIAEA